MAGTLTHGGLLSSALAVASLAVSGSGPTSAHVAHVAHMPVARARVHMRFAARAYARPRARAREHPLSHTQPQPRAATVSGNWAGYVAVGRTRTASTRFKRVVGAWTEPRAQCASGHQTYSAFWVGLGGYRSGATKLEQTGSEADCSKSGHASYSTWYELVPNLPVRLNVRVKPGDTLAASVTLGQSGAVIHMRNISTGRSFAKRIPFEAPDGSSAEWIAEAPSSCGGGGCNTLPLTDFGSMSFTGASAVTVSGRVGSISGPEWNGQAIQLTNDLQAFSATSGPTFASATPGALTSGGSGFSVTWSQQSGPAPSTPTTIGPPSEPPGGGTEG